MATIRARGIRFPLWMISKMMTMSKMNGWQRSNRRMQNSLMYRKEKMTESKISSNQCKFRPQIAGNLIGLSQPRGKGVHNLEAAKRDKQLANLKKARRVKLRQSFLAKRNLA
ncbi:hypothetical protein V1523DRAFT_426003 [Lipomyces doorenjongii]